jgi:hypothetical protein
MTIGTEVSPEQVAISVQEFLVTEQRCPPGWRPFDLYLFRDEKVVFYVGQSYIAFDRVWRHILDGFKGRSAVGRFILCNWPASMRFTVELHSSRSERFAARGHDLNASERWLIETHAPCFNLALNSDPTPLPTRYVPPNSRLTCPRSPSRLIRQAGIIVQADKRRHLISS